MQPVDHRARQEALDPQGSFIVQAPAGSGKTGLLTQRFLRLLAGVERPEQILAITFTRKAAMEMQGRILEALAEALEITQGAQAMPEAAFDQTRVELAKAALQRDRAQGWGLLSNPGRLQVMTIDALCGQLTRQMPILSGFGGQPATDENPGPLYQEAALETLRHTLGDDENSPQRIAVERLLSHRDDHFRRLKALLVQMLEMRDQWLHPLYRDGGIQRESLERALASLVEGQLQAMAQRIPPRHHQTIIELARFAAWNLPDESDSPLMVWRQQEHTDFPQPTGDQLQLWHSVAHLLVTKTGWRRRVDKRHGFPTAKGADGKRFKAVKGQLSELIGELEAMDPSLDMALLDMAQMPLPHYGEEQWAILEALQLLLPRLVVHLKLVFAAKNRTDFTEVALQALHALGTPEDPTDLTLKWDYRLQHILVDEFQDTSLLQLGFLELLTAGWQPGDGRSLFLVGDPMQSIYRFRKAEVAIFGQVQRQGVGMVPLKPLHLSVNFRSRPGVIEWVNDAFAQIFPEKEDGDLGAVPYLHSHTARADGQEQAVQWHPILPGAYADAREAQVMVALVREARRKRPEGSIAILVRGRSHLKTVIPMLRQQGLPYQAVEIDSLERRPVVEDLWSLTRALLMPAGRIAWLAILRAPWCGLTPAELELLASGQGSSTPLWPALQDDERIAQLATDARMRLLRLRETLEEAFKQQARLPLDRWVEGVWHRLGGPATLVEESALEDAHRYFALLQKIEQLGEPMDWTALAERLKRLFATGDEPGPGVVQLMTVHKSKGLEFDTVILPGLQRQPRPDTPPLLLMWEKRQSHWVDLLIAPIASAEKEENPIYSYLQAVHRQQNLEEVKRLLYVAATRAREQLHWVAVVPKEEREPGASSSLGMLWPVLSSMASEVDEEPVDDGVEGETPRPIWSQQLQRLPADWQQPAAPPVVEVGEELEEIAQEGEPPRYDWAGEPARLSGVVTHAWLQRIAESGVAQWQRERIATMEPIFRQALVAEGLAKRHLDKSCERVVDALSTAVSTPLGQWILSDRHQEAASERGLTWVDRGRMQRIIMDRTFVDAQGIRWIIDYKTGIHHGASVDGFLAEEVVRYRQQLEKYGRIVAAMEERPIHLGLYFPLLQAWRWWVMGESRTHSDLPDVSQ
uniref:DNA 3'-5' helicase n=1 Tax=Magnetococcus massalia (strain MO-1) TaxID=451514 RepID=A0A1S7LD45_MAGMO|nr:Putative ATP-dependent deoxyribonuclease (subunit A) [Candidatus Magnetococcus massalia]